MELFTWFVLLGHLNTKGRLCIQVEDTKYLYCMEEIKLVEYLSFHVLSPRKFGLHVFNDGRRFSAAPNILIHFLMHGWGASIWGREKNVGIIIRCRCMV